MENLTDFLTWLISGGGSVMAASWILEQFPAWVEWTNVQAKKWTFFGVAAAIGLGALAAITFVPAATIALLAPYFAVVAAVFAAVFIGEAFHKITKK